LVSGLTPKQQPWFPLPARNSDCTILHRDFAVVERLFGDVKAEACDTTFQFGYEGKPLYVRDLSNTAGLKRLAR